MSQYDFFEWQFGSIHKNYIDPELSYHDFPLQMDLHILAEVYV